MNTHRAIEDGLEDFLAGTVDQEGRVRIEAHLKECADCRQEVEAMREMSGLFATLRSPDPPMPAPGFYARVNQLIEKQQPAPFWAAVLEPLFGKRLALASLLALAAFGTVLVSREMEYTVSPSAETILAVEKDAAAPAADSVAGVDRDQMLYTLASDRQ